MQNLIIDKIANPLPTWLEAMPKVHVFTRAQFHDGLFIQPGILWWRLRADENSGEYLPKLKLREGQYWVLLCDDPTESLTMQALKAGASGCCNSHAAPEVLRQVALVVCNDGLWVGQALLQKIVSSTSRILAKKAEKVTDELLAQLSEREIQVAQLVASGASNREIANQLQISERTVKAHLTTIFEKLGLRDRLQLSLKINGLDI